MIYEKIAEQMYFFNFVFYEVVGKTMYVFCPNCGQTHEIQLNKNLKVRDVKKSVTPCSCFDFRNQPHFYRSCDVLDGLYHEMRVGEFSNDNGDAVLTVYHHMASFSAHNYHSNIFGNVLTRYPVFENKPIIKIRFKADGTMEYLTRTVSFSSKYFYTSWKKAKTWYRAFWFGIIEQSLENLKGTVLEQYVQYVPRIVEAIEEKRNIKYDQLDEMIGAFFVRLHTSQSFRKLFNAGFDRLCTDDVKYRVNGGSFYGGSMSTGNIVCWTAKRLEKILGIQLSKIDKLYGRKSLTVHKLCELQVAAKYEKQNVKMTQENIEIANKRNFDSVDKIFNRFNIPISKAFKYLRGVVRSKNTWWVVSDYADYLSDLVFLGIELTPDVLFPRNLSDAHERYAEVRRQKEKANSARKFSQAIASYKTLDYRDSEYEVKVIRSQKALIAEATKMHNCSAGYVDKILRGTSVLFTVKQVADPCTAYCMLEYSPKEMRIVQNRGIRNTEPALAEQKFVQNWLENIVLPTLIKQVRTNAS